MIEIRNLYKAFGKKEVLKDINLDLTVSGASAILGPNGSGKTTLIKSVMGMVIPDRGSILLNGENTLKQHAYRKHISYLPQIARFPENLTVRELFKWISQIRKEPCNTSYYTDIFELGVALDQRLSTLSGGTRQRVNLVLALMHDHPILILDEPTVGLDPVAMITLRKVIHEEKAKGKIILISTHIMDFVEDTADRVIYLQDGKIYHDGSLQNLKNEHGNVKLEDVIVSILKNARHPVAASQNGSMAGKVVTFS